MNAKELFTYDPTIYWRTINGVLVEIKGMTTPHIINTIAMLEENYKDHPSYYALVEELKKR